MEQKLLASASSSCGMAAKLASVSAQRCAGVASLQIYMLLVTKMNEATIARYLSRTGLDSAYICSARLSTPSAASCNTSDREGWAWTMRAISSLLAANSIAITASAIISET